MELIKVSISIGAIVYRVRHLRSDTMWNIFDCILSVYDSIIALPSLRDKCISEQFTLRTLISSKQTNNAFRKNSKCRAQTSRAHTYR